MEIPGQTASKIKTKEGEREGGWERAGRKRQLLWTFGSGDKMPFLK